eukprot:TRINITY_DN90778_c0_g1_i1.p1 TRINITY_DN90778_c0_g1~~TRINITY_DN90778_c0_g1_i1.p1  ORF type:complete len:267 (-),score=47.22 TRINITY_DN90778_c0_g1_i1:88-855(-)
MEIRVRLTVDTEQRFLDLHVESSDTIRDLKCQLCDKESCASNHLTLVFNGHKLENKRTLSDYNIGQDCTVFAIIAARRDRQFYVLVEQQGKNDRLGFDRSSFYTGDFSPECRPDQPEANVLKLKSLVEQETEIACAQQMVFCREGKRRRRLADYDFLPESCFTGSETGGEIMVFQGQDVRVISVIREAGEYVVQNGLTASELARLTLLETAEELEDAIASALGLHPLCLQIVLPGRSELLSDYEPAASLSEVFKE